MGWLDRLGQGLAKTREALRISFDRLLGTGPDPATLEELEAALLSSDLGVRVVDRVLGLVRVRSGAATEELRAAVHRTLKEILEQVQGLPIERCVERTPPPFVILMVGVNGVGKTTSLAKLAQRLAQSGKKSLFVAGDTFRAAAIDQLQVWADRLGLPLIRHRPGADPAAVAHDGITAAKARNVDVVLIDTAGRLHTKTNLMEELRKVKRVVGQALPGAPQEVLLVVDATSGQNALAQARQFHEAVGVTGLVITKLDGTARGGILVAIAEELKIPVRLIGVGEGVEDLQDFNADAFVQAILPLNTPP
jgi:fused signal recognition particle receptor